MICCFLGHRELEETEDMRMELYRLIEALITKEKVDTFLFGSKSAFNTLCYALATELKEKYPYIKRVFVRAEYPVIGEDYEKYLLQRYEETYYPDSVVGAGRLAYVKRNMEMIDRSQYCVFYYNEEYTPQGRNSGTKIAFEYAKKRAKVICHISSLPGLHTVTKPDAVPQS